MNNITIRENLLNLSQETLEIALIIRDCRLLLNDLKMKNQQCAPFTSERLAGFVRLGIMLKKIQNSRKQLDTMIARVPSPNKVDFAFQQSAVQQGELIFHFINSASALESEIISFCDVDAIS